jgi:ribonuclease HI
VVKAQPSRYTKQVTVFTDCQSAIQSIQKPRLQSRQYLLQEIWQLAEQLTTQGTVVTLQWVPEHKGIEGNEVAHQCARLATRKETKLADDERPQLKSRTL